jgi:hypothetical protein
VTPTIVVINIVTAVKIEAELKKDSFPLPFNRTPFKKQCAFMKT